MPRYKYRATSGTKKRIRGEMVASDEADLYDKLKNDGRYLISFNEIVRKRQTIHFKPQTLADFCRSIGTMQKAGAPLMKSLGFIAGNERLKPKEYEAYEDLQRLIRQGMSLSEAMQNQGAFPPMMIQMFRAAERSGDLDQTAKRLALHYEKEHRLHHKIRSATMYSRLLAVMIVIVAGVLVGYVLPQFESLFSLMDELPLPTRILYRVTGLVRSWWPVLLAVLVIGVPVLQIISKTAPIRLWLDRMKLQLPIFGPLGQTIYTARFARTLSSLYTAGIPIVSAMQIASKTIQNTWLEQQLGQVIPVLQGGTSLSGSIGRIKGFVPKLSFSIKLGEETGGLDSMLLSVADDLDFEAETAINKLTSLVEPILIIAMALIVGFIMIAVMLPIYDSYSVMGMDF